MDFKNTLIIMTSNLGSQYIQEKFEELTDDNKEALMVLIREQVLDLLKRHLRPEFLNRIDENIVFAPLSEADMRGIVEIQVRGLLAKLREMGVSLRFTDEALDLIASLGYDPQFGARPVKRLLQKEVVNPLSKEILAGSVHRDSAIKVIVRNGMIRFEQDEMVSENG